MLDAQEITPDDSLSFVMGVYDGSDGEATMALYKRLRRLGAAGQVAVCVFRAHKNSVRAKRYRGGIKGQGSYRSMAYNRKNESLRELAEALSRHADVCGITWGWGMDHGQQMHNALLFVDLPSGQVSFHCEHRGIGPDYPSRWDGVRGAGPTRICSWVSTLLKES